MAKNWIDIAKEMRVLWSKCKTSDDFLSACMSRYNWNKRQTIQNTKMIYDEHSVSSPYVEELTRKRK